MAYSPLQAAAKYFKYYVHAANSKGHGTHSPFAFEFITKVMNDFTKYDDYRLVETLRRELLYDQKDVLVEDMGAGSVAGASKKRSIATIAKNAAKPKKFSQLLYRMVRFYKPQVILELGTSLGITTSYLALANPSATVITLEGSDALAAKARENFLRLNIKNIQVITGNFDVTLSGVLKRFPRIDFAFVDGNHRREPTERYFTQLLPNVDNDSLLVFDDIHWSKEMEEAWYTIIRHPEVLCDIDLFYIGIINFRQEFKEKQGFSIRF